MRRLYSGLWHVPTSIPRPTPQITRASNSLYFRRDRFRLWGIALDNDEGCAYVLIAAIGVLLMSDVWALRCGSKLIKEGMLEADVIALCGESRCRGASWASY